MMKRKTTEELINELAGAPAPKSFRPGRAGFGFAGTVFVGMAIVWATAGWRADLAASLTAPVTLAKLLLPLSLCLIALYYAISLSRPDAGKRIWPVLIPVSAAIALLLATVSVTPTEMMMSSIAGQTALSCVSSVLALSIAPLLAGIALLRNGASTRPQLSGLLIGLASASGAAASYALHCTEDSPLFFVTWYGAGIMLSAAAGALVGGRLLRW
jgi:hypothetical protein